MTILITISFTTKTNAQNIKELQIIDGAQLLIDCGSGRVIEILSAKWVFQNGRSQEHFRGDQEKRFNLLKLDQTDDYRQKWNNKRTFVERKISKVMGRDTRPSYLEFHVKYECLLPCPNAKFIAKHIAPIGRTAENYAPEADLNRNVNAWLPTRKVTIFTNAATMIYERDPNRKHICKFTVPALKNLCEKIGDDENKKSDRKGYYFNPWRCTREGMVIAEHNALDGHYNIQ